MKWLAGLLILVSAPALADERIHLQPPLPGFCKEVQPPSGICVRGDKDYRLIGGRVVWIDVGDPNAKEFFDNKDRYSGGVNESSGGAASK